jgi:uncharacterized protein YjcR
MAKSSILTPKQRKNKAFEYYLTGLNSKEIAILLNCSFRTIQNFMHKEKWKQKRAAIRANN